ncbi:MAG TPA: metalloregulator ArsR/SmtB family transcription factor [Terriglobia bacterium]|nr:metalloregulator ArsR/SmtB family transcription factor [Terriglobia bacterium]
MKEMEQVFRALADATRLRILNLLLHGELCVCDIQFVLDSPQPNVSRHLTYLKNAGLVQDRREGPRIYYSFAQNTKGVRKDLFAFLWDLFRQSRDLKEDLRKLSKAVERGRSHARSRQPSSPVLTLKPRTANPRRG